MRKIETKEDAMRKRRKNQIIVGAVLVGLMIVSTLGYSLMNGASNQDKSSQVTEGGYVFTREGNLWKTSIDGQTFRFQYLPSELENVPVEGNYELGAYYNQPVYFVNLSPGVSEILMNLQDYILRYQEACLNGTECNENLPVKNCDSDLIIFINGNETKVYNKQNCVFIEGEPIMGADAFLYRLLKI